MMADIAKCQNPVATTWLISFEQIRRCDPLAADYLSLMACVEPKHIPQNLLPPGPSPKKEVDAIGTLNAYSFISRRPADAAFDLHRLVHMATRNWLRKEGKLHQSTENAITRLENKIFQIIITKTEDSGELTFHFLRYTQVHFRWQ